MGIWTKHIAGIRPRVMHLSTHERTQFAAYCVNNSFLELRPSFEASSDIAKPDVTLLASAIQLLLRDAEKSQLMAAYAKVAALEPDESCRSQAVPGWVHCISAVAVALEIVLYSDRIELVLESIECAYRAIEHREAQYFTSKRGESLDSSNRSEFESSSAWLATILERQEACLNAIEIGST